MALTVLKTECQPEWKARTLSTGSAKPPQRHDARELIHPAYQYRVQLDFIRPGKPVENSYIESFNGRLRDECLNVEVFFALADVRDKLERWRQDYNQVRPHSALRDNAPALFAMQWAETATPDPEPVPASAGKPATGLLN